MNYSYVHWYNNKTYPKTGICAHCGLSRVRHEWALIHGKEHKKGIENYIELCKKCHIAYDRTEEWVRNTIKSLSKTYTHQNPIKPRLCELCSKSYTPKRKERRFCSNSCSSKWKAKAGKTNKSHDPITGRWLALHKK